MSEELIVDNCSPTLAGIKTGNLFSVKITEGIDIISEVRRLNRELRKKGKEVVKALDDFLDNRSESDFSSLSDDEIRKSWEMNYENMIPMFRMLRSFGDDFKILIDKSAGTRFENFSHDYVIKMSYAYEHFYKEAYRRGIAKAKVDREEFHILLTSFWDSICEPFVHDMQEKEMEEHCRVMCRFFDWASVIKMTP